MPAVNRPNLQAGDSMLCASQPRIPPARSQPWTCLLWTDGLSVNIVNPATNLSLVATSIVLAR